MAEYTRRALLIGGGSAIGSAMLLGAQVAASPTSQAAPASFGGTGTLPVSRFPDPVQLTSLMPTSSPNVMQQFERTRSGQYFMTQAKPGATAGFDTTIISRLQASGAQLDSMTVLDGGHGLGLHIESRLGRTFVWMSLQGSSAKGPTNGGRLAVFRYTPGVYAIDAIPGGVDLAPQFRNSYGEYQESIYNFDWAKGFAVERMYDFHTGHQERYTRRRIADILLGRDRPYGQMTIPVNPPTLQGFTTVNDAFFRWDGLQNSASGQLVTDDPIMLEQYDWRSGQRIGVRAFPTLGQDGGIWRDGAYEPEGMSVYREADGSASLLVGITTGVTGDHAWPVYRFARIGSA